MRRLEVFLLIVASLSAFPSSAFELAQEPPAAPAAPVVRPQPKPQALRRVARRGVTRGAGSDREEGATYQLNTQELRRDQSGTHYAYNSTPPESSGDVERDMARAQRGFDRELAKTTAEINAGVAEIQRRVDLQQREIDAANAEMQRDIDRQQREVAAQVARWQKEFLSGSSFTVSDPGKPGPAEGDILVKTGGVLNPADRAARNKSSEGLPI